MNLLKIALIAVFMVVLLCACKLAGARDGIVAAPGARADFAGKWTVTVEPDEDARKAGEKTFEDTLVFEGGKFTSEACKKHGFGPVEYEEDTRRFGPAKFTAEPSSDKEGKAKWTGMVTAAEISGDMVWTKKDGTVLRYSFKGEKKH